MKSLSLDVAKAAIELSMTESREDEHQCIERLKRSKIDAVAVDIGGDLVEAIPKVIERAVIAARRTGIIPESHVYEGAIAGAAKEAIHQVVGKGIGLSVGGKIGIARSGEHLTCSIFMSVGLLHFNDVAIGLAHRSIPNV